MKYQPENNSKDKTVIRFSLRKPRDWNWCVDTSSSSSTTIIPSIQLWDEEEGSLLVDTRYSSELFVVEDNMQKSNVDKQIRMARLASKKLPNVGVNMQDNINSDSLDGKRTSGISMKRVNNNGQVKCKDIVNENIVVVNDRKKFVSKVAKVDTSCRTLPVKYRKDSNLLSRSLNGTSRGHRNEGMSKINVNSNENISHLSRKDTFENIKNNLKPTFNGRRRDSNTKNCLSEEMTKSASQILNRNGNGSKLHRRISHHKEQQMSKDLGRIPTQGQQCLEINKQTKLPMSKSFFKESKVKNYDVTKPAFKEASYKNRIDACGKLPRDEPFRKELKFENYHKSVKNETDTKHIATKRTSRNDLYQKINNDLKHEETTTSSLLRNPRKHAKSGSEQRVRVGKKLDLPEDPILINTMHKHKTGDLFKLHNGNREIKHDHQRVTETQTQSTGKRLENVNGKIYCSLGKSLVINRLNKSGTMSEKSVRKNQTRSLSGIPVKKQHTSEASTANREKEKCNLNKSVSNSNRRENILNVDRVEKIYHKQTERDRKLQAFDGKEDAMNETQGMNCSSFQGRTNKKLNTKSKKKVYKPPRGYGGFSSSSSEAEITLLWNQPKKKWSSRSIKGDRLLGINGQCIRHPEEARDLLRQSGDVVSLQLSRNVIGSQSLPRNRADSPHEPEDNIMGSNVSRHSGKGLTGRRSQSSGNLCNGKIMRPSVGRFFSPCSRSEVDNVGPRDRYKFCGSLPNHLDAKDPVSDEMSETDDDSSYKNNNNVPVLNHQIKNKKNVELRLHPLVSKGTQHGQQDSVTNDQGYASERSPEDELPPSVVGTCPVHHKPTKQQYPIITKNSTFSVTLQKGTRGLGLSVTGGIETDERWPGLIRIKRLFPHQPAWQSGHLAQGDILIAANNTPLTGLTNYEALEVLRTTPTEVVLTVCRPPPEIQLLNAPAGTDSAPTPPKRDLNPASGLLLPLKRQESFGEFQITLKKVNGSLGFTLRKEDESVLGHYVRALVKEPALSDGRIKPGDKIVAVNNVPMSPMSHEEAVMFLRQCDEEVHLKLFRDPVQTPVLALSPTEAHRTFKPILRKEAQDMLSDLAVKKSLSPNDSTGSSTLSRLGRSSSPRKRRLTKTPSPDDQLNGLSSDELDSSSQNQIVEEAESPVGVGPLPSEPVSMPPVLSSSSTGGFSYRNPAYRSANPSTTKSKGSMCEELPENRCSDNDLSGSASGGVEGSKSLLKWKGVLFSPEDRSNSVNSPEDSISQITETDESSNNQVLVIELMRGWNSRLGFSLQQAGASTVISAIHPDSVASRDGRLKPGDQLVMVNDESVERMSTSEVIDLLRRIRGVICITIWRKLKD